MITKKQRISEKHVTVSDDIHTMLRSLAKKESRSMRAVISRLIKKEFEK